MSHHNPPGYFGPSPRHCPCCGAVEQQSGCVRGFTCQCAWNTCGTCLKCAMHCRCQPRTLFKKNVASYGYQSGMPYLFSEFATKAEAERILDALPGRIIENNTGLGWPKQWRIVKAEIEEHSDYQGVVVAHCEAVKDEER